jgi:RNA polymerase sigma factor (sigma-70 family)
MDFEKFFLDHLSTIDRAIEFACRRGRFLGADAEDFASVAKLRLIENDYAILRNFEGRCSFRAYILIVVQRMLVDYRNHLLGKWRPSAHARRMGEIAVEVEKKLYRDHTPFDEVVRLMCLTNPELTKDAIERLSEGLRARRRRVNEAVALVLDESPPTPDDRLRDRDRVQVTEQISAIIRRAISELPADDRVIVRLRFESQFTVAQISRALQIDAKPIYRRIDRVLREWRERLKTAGITVEMLEDVLANTTTQLDFGFDPPPQRHDRDNEEVPV